MLEPRQTFTLSRVEGRAGERGPTPGGGGCGGSGGGFVTPRRSAPARACLGERSQTEGGCECAIGEYVTNRSIIFPQYDLSSKKKKKIH